MRQRSVLPPVGRGRNRLHELGPRQITVNSVSPGVTKGAGVFTSTSEDDPNLQHMIDQTP